MKPYFIAGYNFDIKLLEFYKENGVNEIFAGVDFFTNFGSGRILSSGNSYLDIIDHFVEAKKAGIKTSILFNPACTGNKEMTSAGLFEILFIARIINKYKIDYIVVSNPWIGKIFKELSPSLKIKMSSHYNCDNIGKLEMCFDIMDFDMVILSQFANKNFKLLREATRRWDPNKFEIMCTVACMAGCPWRTWHADYYAHGTDDGVCLTTGYAPCNFNITASSISCLNTTFIRKQDIKHYQDLGINHFKIGERGNTTDFNKAIVQHYLIDEKDFSCFNMLLHDIWKIDFSKLDGFYEKFVKEECTGTKYNCRDCMHCEQYAKKAFVNYQDIPIDKNSLNNTWKHYCDNLKNFYDIQI